MRFLVLWFLLIDSTLTAKGSRVDVALETVLEIDKSLGKLFVKELHNAVRDIVGDISQKSERKHIPKALDKYEFSEFLKDAIDITNTLDDDKLVELISIVNDELDLADSKTENDRRYFNKEIDAPKHKKDEIRRNLDNLIKNLTNDKKDSKSNVLTKIIKALYERNSKQKILNTMKNLRIFSKSKIDNELMKSIKKSIRTIISNINLSGNKYGKLRTFFDDLMKENDDNRSFKSNHARFKLKSNRQTDQKRFTKKYKNKASRYTTKQTYMTLYPESISFIDKSKVETFSDRSSKTESDDDENSSNVESETNESIINEVHRSTNEVETDGERVKNERIKTNKVESGGVKVKHERKKEKYKKYEKARASKKLIDAKTSQQIKNRYKTKQTYKTQNTKTTKWDVIEKDIIWSTSKSSESLERFGNLYKQTEDDDEETIKQHTTKQHTTNSKSEKTLKTTKAKVNSIKAFTFKYDYRRLADNSNYNAKINYTTNKLPTSKIEINFTNVSRVTKKEQPKLEDVAKSTIIEETKVNSTKSNNGEKITTKMYENITKEENTLKSQSFDINSYIKNSDLQDIKDVNKKNEIERKMKEDLKELFDSPTDNASTTDSYTDIFKDLEDEFGLR